jgi:glycosyltransferase involved in cell wall biosynthesis
MVLILSNSSKAHIEESQSFLESAIRNKEKAKIIITDFNKNQVGTISLKKISAFLNLELINNIKKIIKENNVSKVIITAPIPTLLFLVHFLKKNKIRVIYTFHEPFLNQKNIYSFLSNLFHKIFVKYVDNFIFYSDHSKENFVKHYTSIGTKGIFVFPLFKPRVNIKKSIEYSQKKYISFIGNIGANKNLNYLIDIAKIMPDQYFLIAGYGDISKYEIRLSELNNIKIINRFLSDDEYYRFIDISKFVLLPYSSTSQSGVLIDVICRGSIVVGTKTGSNSEIIKSNLNGFLLNYNNYCEEFIEIINGEIDFNKISQNALDYYNKNMTFESFYINYLKLK